MFKSILKSAVSISIINSLGAAPAQPIKEITSMGEFQEIINNKKDACIIFYAPWCQACNSMKDTFLTGAEKYKDSLDFIKVDASNEKLKEAVDMFGIQAIPTIFYKHVGQQNKERFLQSLSGFTGKAAVQQKITPKKVLVKKLAHARRTAARRPVLKKIAIPRARKV